MSALHECPYCGKQADLDLGRGDLHPCPSCGMRFWAGEGGGPGQRFETPVPRKGAFWTAWVVLVSVLVLVAELLLAAALYGGAVLAVAGLAGVR